MLIRLVFAFVVAISGQVQAAFINNATGLVAPISTVTFDEISFANGTVISTQFSSYGVTFSPALSLSDRYKNGYPNMNGSVLSNFEAGERPYTQPFSIKFNNALTEAAFAFVSNPSPTTTFSAYLGGNLVESATTSTEYSGNFYGFNSIVLDEIRISTIGSSGAMILDNVQLGLSAVPEPTTMALFGLGAAGMGLVVRRKKSRIA